MALVEKPKRLRVIGQRIGDAIWNNRKIVIFVLYLLGIASVGILPLLSSSGNVDEKSLLLGIARPSGGRKGKDVQRILKEMMTMAKESSSKVPSERGTLLEKVREASSLLEDSPAAGKRLEWTEESLIELNGGCQVVQGMLEASRSDGTESIVFGLLVDLDRGLSDDSVMLTVALGQVLAAHVQEQGWLAKNVVFLFVESSLKCSPLVSMKKWINGSLDSWDPDKRIGQVQQAVFLQVRRSTASSVGGGARLHIHGFDGQIPNFDMVMAARRNIEFYLPHAGIVVDDSPKMTRMVDVRRTKPVYHQQVGTLAKFMMRQALGIPTGPHAVFLSRNIDAVTVSIDVNSQSKVDKTEEQLLQLSEMLIRTLNNLHEKFHHSTSLYGLCGAFGFVEIGVYLIPSAILLLAQILATLSLLDELDKSLRQVHMAHCTGAAALLHLFISLLFILLSQSIKWYHQEGEIRYGAFVLWGLQAVGGAAALTFITWKYVSTLMESEWPRKPKRDTKKINHAARRANARAGKAAFAAILTTMAFPLFLWRSGLAWFALAILIPLEM